jgi:hypothetical protein
MELTKKQLREQREFQTLFKNPKHARSMWAQTVLERYSKPAFEPIIITDKDGNISPESQIEISIWKHLKKELESEGLDRLPTDGEMMEACQAYYARHTSSSYTARRDSMGAKPIDETKQSHIVNNPLEELSDEELFVIQKALDEYRNAQLKLQEGNKSNVEKESRN